MTHAWKAQKIGLTFLYTDKVISTYANKDTIPEGWTQIPIITGKEKDISKFNLPQNYAVLTTESTSKSRTLKTETLNGIIDYMLKSDITPVILGKKKLEKNYIAKSPENLNTKNMTF